MILTAERLRKSSNTTDDENWKEIEGKQNAAPIEAEVDVVNVAYVFRNILRHRNQTWFPVKFAISGLEHPYQIKKPIIISLEKSDDSFISSFEEANIHTSGDNTEEALENIASLIVDIFEDLSEEKSDSLGKEANRQLATLKDYVRKISENA